MSSSNRAPCLRVGRGSFVGGEREAEGEFVERRLANRASGAVGVVGSSYTPTIPANHHAHAMIRTRGEPPKVCGRLAESIPILRSVEVVLSSLW